MSSAGHPDPTASGTFCILPWIHVEVMPGGECKACCIAQELIQEKRVPLTVAGRTLEEIRGSRHMTAMRAALASGRAVPACATCGSQEARGEKSQRHIWNERFAPAILALARRVEQGGSPDQPLPLEYLQLGLGNKCNLACRMCNASYSSRIAEDPVHLQWAPPVEHLASAETRVDWAADLPWFEQPRLFDEDLLAGGATLKLLNVTGGEPMLSGAFLKLLDDYAARGWSRNIAVRVSSNLFHNEDRVQKFVDALTRFHYSSVGASVDGCGPVYEYIRRPARWAIVERNIRAVAARASTAQNRLVLTLDTVVQPYNCLNLVELLRFADELGIEANPHVIEHPWFLRMQVVPRELRLEAAGRLRGYVDSPGDGPFQAANRQHALRVARHLEGLEDDAQTASARERFMQFTGALDASRGQRLADCIPELAAALAPRPTVDLAPRAAVAEPALPPRRGLLARLARLAPRLRG